jgi:hypothetical protein
MSKFGFDEEETFVVGKDGTAYVAVREDFINLQESDAGFGTTRCEAITALLEAEENARAHAAKRLDPG